MKKVIVDMTERFGVTNQLILQLKPNGVLSIEQARATDDGGAGRSKKSREYTPLLTMDIKHRNTLIRALKMLGQHEEIPRI